MKGIPTKEYKRLIEFVNENNHKRYEHSLILDIGSRACRILITSKSPGTNDWSDERTTYQRSIKSNWKKLVEGERNILDFTSDRNTIRFFNELRTYVQELKKFKFVESEDMVATGSALFREIGNRGDFLSAFRGYTGLGLKIPEPHEESMLSHVALFHTLAINNLNYTARDDEFPHILVDQGGWSLDVSYSVPKQKKIFHLGSTTKLNESFLLEEYHDKMSPGIFSPWPENLSVDEVKHSLDEMNSKIKARIQTAIPPGRIPKGNAIFYVTGDVIKNILSRNNLHHEHNAEIEVSAIDPIAELERSLKFLSVEKGGIAIWRLKSDKQVRRILRKHFRKRVLKLLLIELGARTLRYCGFGLRYGVYYYKYHPTELSFPGNEISCVSRGTGPTPN